MPSLHRDRSHHWRKARRMVLERDAHLCQVQIAGVCTSTATVVHHTLGQAITGNDPAHLLASCAECNTRIGRPDAEDAAPKRTTRW